MKNKYNTLSKYIFEYSEREYRRESIEALFRAVLEPVISNQKLESCVLLKLNNYDNCKSLIQRLNFSSANILKYDDNSGENCSKENIWGSTEFIVVLSQRYSAVLIWDYSYSVQEDCSNICLLYNSKIITDIAKSILDNSTVDFKSELEKYIPDRRENLNMNLSVNTIALMLNDRIEEYRFSENEKDKILDVNDTYKTAEIVANKAKFIAHEIKNNLSIINLYSKILEKRLENVKFEAEISESVNNSIKNITNASENVSSLISDLRCLSLPYKTEFSLKQFILNTVMQCEEKANKAEVEIKAEDFKDITVNTDKLKLQCTLTNLIYNAIEACKKGNKINTECIIRDNSINIYVKNNGDMIPTEIQGKIFDSEFTTKEEGNGLGLAVCKIQMEQINGSVELEKSDEKETVFKITLPVN